MCQSFLYDQTRIFSLLDGRRGSDPTIHRCCHSNSFNYYSGTISGFNSRNDTRLSHGLICEREPMEYRSKGIKHFLEESKIFAHEFSPWKLRANYRSPSTCIGT
ncbi:uncharacterized protein LOC130770385 [Actinidia eriantha]|uniref:uncharacterized protein LOC130770385 n=1 Tax=Actinidia eriantha TaxID=165200 RepID=UPI0025857F91|nr:uncharacterized protein LOC130770385 [Actinidia eriantha]